MEEDLDLVASCVAPLVARVKTPDRMDQRAFIQALNADQGVLFIFWALYSHSRQGLSGFSYELPHRLVSPGFWTFLALGLGRIGADDMLDLIGRWRALVEPALATAGYDLAAGVEPQLEYDALVGIVAAVARVDADALAGLDEEYRRLAPGALHRMADYLRSHPQARFTSEDPSPGSFAARAEE